MSGFVLCSELPQAQPRAPQVSPLISLLGPGELSDPEVGEGDLCDGLGPGSCGSWGCGGWGVGDRRWKCGGWGCGSWGMWEHGRVEIWDVGAWE